MFNKDYNIGLKYEIALLPILKSFFNDITIHQLDRFNTFDYKGENKYIELKVRNCSHNKYETTMMGLNKIEKARFIKEEVFFVFKFTDGLYYYKFKRSDKLILDKGGRTDRGLNEIKDYIFIPNKLLEKMV